jgi:predicted NBD/HSP70 family sugar kinase
MRRLRPGSKQTIRGINRAIVLNLVKQHGALSRTRLAALSALAVPTISEIVTALLDEGLLVETSAVVSERRGPRPVLLELNRGGGYAIGTMLRPDGMNLVVTDLLGDVITRSYRPFVPGAAPDEVLAAVAREVRAQILAAGIAWASLLGLGVSMTGVIDSITGVCRHAYILGWRDVHVGEILEATLGLPVYVDNDNRMLTVAEQHFGHGRGHQHFVLVTVGRGVGMGAVVGGELLRGHHDIGAEFGHVTIQLDGPPCPCGKRGCLEAIASDVGIMRAARDAHLAGPGETIEALTERARDDARLRGLFEAAGIALGMGVAGLINIFGPALLVLTGEGLRAGDMLLAPLHQTLARCVFGDRLQHTQIAITPWSPSWEPWARGAASMVLERLLRPQLFEHDLKGSTRGVPS